MRLTVKNSFCPIIVHRQRSLKVNTLSSRQTAEEKHQAMSRFKPRYHLNASPIENKFMFLVFDTAIHCQFLLQSLVMVSSLVVGSDMPVL